MPQSTYKLRFIRRPLPGVLVTLALITVLAACSPAAQPSAPAQAPAATEAPTQAPAATEAPTQASAATEAPTQAPAATEAPTQAPAATEAPAQAPAAAVTFAATVQPILEQRCINCHGGKDGIKGDLSMRSYDDLMKGGSEGPAIAAGDPANSLLVKLISAGEMPKRAPKLPQDEIDAIAAWIAAGAQND